jgi:hypothetical protein
MFLKEKRENISVLPRRELSILLEFSNLGRIENPYGFSQFCYLRQNQIVSGFGHKQPELGHAGLLFSNIFRTCYWIS